MPAFGAERGIVHAQADAHRGLQADGHGKDKIATASAVALRDRERRWHDLRRGVAQRRAMHIAHRYGGDQVAIQQRGAGKRQLLAADDARFARAAERRGEGADLLRLVALAAGDGARQCVEDEVLDALPDRLRQVVVLQAGDEARQLGGWRHSSLAPESLTAFAHFTSSDLMSAVNSSGEQIAGSAARLTSRSRMSGMR